nr:hypothetical protein JVH1_6517 [Rhodococcus sp. JVH1]
MRRRRPGCDGNHRGVIRLAFPVAGRPERPACTQCERGSGNEGWPDPRNLFRQV